MMVCTRTRQLVGVRLLPADRASQEQLGKLQHLLVVAPREVVAVLQLAVDVDEEVVLLTGVGRRDCRQLQVCLVDGLPGLLQRLQ